MNKKETIVVIGAGPAGLTAAYELSKKNKQYDVLVYELSDFVGGLSRTANYKGNRIDIGGHRFFSKSTRVMEWWQEILPIQNNNILEAEQPIDKDNIKKLIIRNRLSRIFFLRKFFNYPINLSAETILRLGLVRVIKIIFSYFRVVLFPLKQEHSLENFFINRFGRELYNTFFKDYTEKLWGRPCSEISSEWGSQRIKGLSILSTLKHVFRKTFLKQASIYQKDTETSLIEKFLYPKLGPGQMWEEVAGLAKNNGVKIFLNHAIVGVNFLDDKIISVLVKNIINNEVKEIATDYLLSSMPIKDLANCFKPALPENILEVTNGLVYRDFITVGILIDNTVIIDNRLKNDVRRLSDNWIYIQEPDVKIGRLQIFNNWSPYLVNDKNNTWLGLEYFCNELDDFWLKSDKEIIDFAITELAKLKLIDQTSFLDATVIRVSKAYPAYFGTYNKISVFRDFVDKIENLFLIGRNGMHKYNNQDHSILTAMSAVENIINKEKSKENIWKINTEKDYQEKTN